VKNAKEIREYYNRLRDKAIDRLRASCKHQQVSDWETEWWALAHSTGFEIQYCRTCEIVLHRKTRCTNLINGKLCARVIVDDEIQEGDGKELPLGGHYCKDCAQGHAKKMRRPIGKGPPAEALVRRMRDGRAKSLSAMFGSNPRLRSFTAKDETETHKMKGIAKSKLGAKELYEAYAALR
jgi:hypothetical protein